MNVLLIGGSGHLMNQLIIKYKKEGYRVYLLTGSHYKKSDYARVFECYQFSYDSDDLYEIFESVNPDVTVCLGAFDTNFRWNDPERELVKYVSSFMNILIGYATAKRGRFIYLSSHEVFGMSGEGLIDERQRIMAIDHKGSALAEAEKFCLDYREKWDLDIIVLRVDHLYLMPETREDIVDCCSEMCVRALEKGNMIASREKKFSMIYESDVVQYTYLVSARKKVKHDIYHLSSEEVISEYYMASMIQKNCKDAINIVEDYTKHKCILSNERLSEEFGTAVYHHSNEMIPKIIKHICRHRERFVSYGEQPLSWWKVLFYKFRWFLRRMIPFIENLICFVPFFMLNNRSVGSEYFAKIDFYLFYVLLFAIIHGQQQAIFSAVLAVSGYLFRQMYTRSGFEVALDYTTYVWMAQLFILGLAVGYMRDQIRSIKKESREIESHLERQLTDIKDINSSNVRVKDVLETQVIDQRDSIGKIYNITSALDQYTPSEVMFYAVEMMCKLLHSPDVAIYMVANPTFARLFSASSETARQMGNSIKYRETGEMFDDMKEHRVYINRSLEPEYPLMANAIYEQEEMRMIIMVWGIPWERMTLSQANLLVVISYLIQNALLRANRYLEALEEERYLPNTSILEPEAFESLVQAYDKAKKKNLTVSTLLEIQTRQYGMEQAGEILKDKLRQADYLGMMRNGNLYVLLTNTNASEAEIVRGRFAQIGIESKIVDRLEG